MTGSIKTNTWVVIHKQEIEGEIAPRPISIVLADTRDAAYSIFCDSVDIPTTRREAMRGQFSVLRAGFDELMAVHECTKQFMNNLLGGVA